MKRHRRIRDDETHDMSIGHADAIAIFLRDAARVNMRIDPAVDQQHRARLRRESRMRARFEKASGFRHAGAGAVDPEHAIRSEMKIADAGLDIGLVQTMTVFDIKPDRREIVVIHAGVHRENEVRPPPRDGIGQTGEVAIRRAGGVAQKQAD